MKAFENKKILAIDYGEKVLGTALYHMGRDPYPMPYLRLINTGEEAVLRSLKEFVDDEFVEVLVFGVPYLLDGGETPKTRAHKEFFKKLNYFFSDIACFEQDETLSTFEAKERMKSSPRYNFQINFKELDNLSAVIILEDFLKEMLDNNQG